MKKIIIQGSSRSKGNTFDITQALKEKLDCDYIDLSTKNIQLFDYEFKNQEDDFLPLIKELLENYDVFIFASPVYWYTMSATLKIFFDRFTDCVLKEKELGRKFEGKHMAALCCGSSEDEIDSYFIPFRESAKYLKMNYIGDVHTWKDSDEIDEKVIHKLQFFSNLIESQN
ncbi:flavodoxin family protein [Aureivirga marina]|uniref:flavodoxin family protein n=1 Tax=Aureivirga marina TaxID=1182451 RepID=UPI0018CABC86|nr:flavodoxin family protein [Aureivirga marina]